MDQQIEKEAYQNSQIQNRQAQTKESEESFTNSFVFKCIIVFCMVLVFQIPMIFINNLVRDRTNYHTEAEDSILEPKGGRPEFQGALIAVPCEKITTVTTTTDTADGKKQTNTEKIISRYVVFITPENLTASTNVKPEKLQRGIFEVPVFNSDLSLSGFFDGIEEDSLKENTEMSECNVLWNESLFIIGISNKKILTSLPEIKVGGVPLSQSLYEKTIGSPFDNTIYYDLGEKARDGFKFIINAKIQGGQLLALTPIATENKFNIDSVWNSPGFGGGWLPTNREIGEDGFKAEWNIPGLSTKFPKRWTCRSENNYRKEIAVSYNVVSDDDYNHSYKVTSGKYPNSISVSFYQPVDNYQKVTRSTKYSILFLIIPFIALLIFEVFTRIRIHPVQYALIGLANIVFYLLLLSISEHIPFNATYWISCSAVSLLMFIYGASIFRKVAYGGFFAAVNLVSYIFLFGTLQAEDYALLIGSIGIFIVVAVLMILTRKIDWYNLKKLYRGEE